MTKRMVVVVIEVADVERSAVLYREAFGIDLHLDDHEGGAAGAGDRWTSGRHAAFSCPLSGLRWQRGEPHPTPTGTQGPPAGLSCPGVWMARSIGGRSSGQPRTMTSQWVLSSPSLVGVGGVVQGGHIPARRSGEHRSATANVGSQRHRPSHQSACGIWARATSRRSSSKSIATCRSSMLNRAPRSATRA